MKNSATTRPRYFFECPLCDSYAEGDDQPAVTAFSKAHMDDVHGGPDIEDDGPEASVEGQTQ